MQALFDLPNSQALISGKTERKGPSRGAALLLSSQMRDRIWIAAVPSPTPRIIISKWEFEAMTRSLFPVVCLLASAAMAPAAALTVADHARADRAGSKTVVLHPTPDAAGAALKPLFQPVAPGTVTRASAVVLHDRRGSVLKK